MVAAVAMAEGVGTVVVAEVTWVVVAAVTWVEAAAVTWVAAAAAHIWVAVVVATSAVAVQG